MDLQKINSVDINNGIDKYAQVTLCVEEDTGLAIVQIHTVDESAHIQMYYLPKLESDDSLVIQTSEQGDAFMLAVQAASIQSLTDFGKLWMPVSALPVMETQYVGALPFVEVELFVMEASNSQPIQ